MHRLPRHLFLGVALICLIPLANAFAQVMQSDNYRIQSDSINVGGAYSSSTNYSLEDTAGEVATGYSSSTDYEIGAGYQQMQSSYLALSAVADVELAPALGGITGGTASGSTTAHVLTDNIAGYQLTITASSSPAMSDGSHTISDYAPAGADPDFSFSTPAAAAHLAFSPQGADIDQRYRDDGAACNTGSGDTTLACWDGLSTTPRAIATRTSANQPDGTDTVIEFRVGIGNSVVQPEGEYYATTTLTALPL